MAKIIFIIPSFFTFKELNNVLGCTDGQDIYINVYCRALVEQSFEFDINMVHIHELVHILDMSLTEEQVEYVTQKLIYL